jgi:hypothetical protein
VDARRLLVGVMVLAGGPRAAAQGVDTAEARRQFWVRPVASVIVPGTGQLMAHQSRAAVYFAVELYALTRFVQLTVVSHRDADRFRDLAFQVARAAFQPTQRDTAFEYFETMQRFRQSGQFDRDPGAAFLPEADTTTFNGSMWLLARRTYWVDPNRPPDPRSPEYARAVTFYETHAVGTGYLWSWTGSEEQLGVFRETIRQSDNAAREAQDQLGLLLANHLVSAVDAFISSRLEHAAHRPITWHTTLTRGLTSVTLSVGF